MGNNYNINLRMEYDRILDYALPYLIFGYDIDKLEISKRLTALWRRADGDDMSNFEPHSEALMRYIQNTEKLDKYSLQYMTAFNYNRNGLLDSMHDLTFRVEILEFADNENKSKQPDVTPKEKKCHVCEAVIGSDKRSMYCSNKCKQAAYRNRKK